MLIISGHLTTSATDRDRLVRRSADSVAQARRAPGCLDFAVSSDALDPTRVNVYERWADAQALERFRAGGPDDETAALIVAAAVERYDVAARGPA